jgi:hypothetical protein
MNELWRLWDAVVVITGPYGAVALIAFLVMVAIAWLLSRSS